MPSVVDFDTLPQLYDRLADHYAGSDHAALRYKDKATKAWTDITHDELKAQVEALAGFLYQRGVRKGDRVAILSENRPEWAVTDLATQMLGAVTVALYTTVPASQVAYILQDSGAKALVVSTGLQLRKADKAQADCPELAVVVSMAEPRKVREALPLATWDDALASATPDDVTAARAEGATVTPDDLAVLIYTSGTTGMPKGVMLTHANVCSNAKAAHQRLTIDDSDLHLSFLPLSHAFERTAGYTCMLSGGATIAYAESVDLVAKNLPEVRPTIMISVPRLFEKVYSTIQRSVQDGSPLKRGIFAWAVDTGKAMARKRREGKSGGPILRAQYALAHRLVFSTLHEKLGGRIRFAVSGGAALPREIGEFFEAAGVTIVEGYGLSETSPVLAANPLEAPRFGTVGHVFPGVVVAIRDLHTGQILGRLRGEEVPKDLTTGDGEILADGDPIMRGYWNRPDETDAAFDEEGWFRSGDVGRFEGGYLRITDRIKHMIVSKGGKNIYPGPIEESFVTNPLVEQILVVGEGREFLTALIVPEREALATELASRDADPEADLGSEPVQAVYDEIVRGYSRGAASHEKIRGFRLIDEPFSVENELLTPTMKPKRKQIEARYADLVESMYADVS